MKTLLAATCALLVGGALGAFLMRAYDAKESYTQGMASIQQLFVQMRTQTCLDLALLEELETGKPDRVKSVVARQVASYYNTFHDFKPMSPETREVMQRIEASTARLPALQEALAKKDK